ncbi:MAG: hypothetical protein ABS951_00080 [Solibacillus sp.]
MKKSWLLPLLLLVLVACSATNETDANTQGESGIMKAQVMTLFGPGTYKGSVWS